MPLERREHAARVDHSDELAVVERGSGEKLRIAVGRCFGQLTDIGHLVDREPGLAPFVLGDDERRRRAVAGDSEEQGQVEHGQDTPAEVSDAEHRGAGSGHGRDVAELGDLEHVLDRKRIQLFADAHPDVKGGLFRYKAQDRYPFGDKSFDCVVSLGTLHNLKIFELQAALQEAAKSAGLALTVEDNAIFLEL